MVQELGNPPQKSDLLAVILSFSAGIIQLLLFVISTISQVTNLQNLFINPELVPFTILLSLILALCFVGTISYFQKNKDFISEQSRFKPWLWIKEKLFITAPPNPMSRSQSKRNLVSALVILLFTTFVFVVATFYHLDGSSYLWINASNASFYQIISFMLLWLFSTLIIFVWTNNEIEKSKQFQPQEFIPNFIRSLQKQGYINIKIKNDIQLNDGNHLVSAQIQEKDHYFAVQFDGGRIIRELEKNQFDQFFTEKK